MSSNESANIPPPEHVRVLGEQGWIGLVDRMGDETSVVNAARVSFGKRRTALDDRDRTLIRYLIEHRHTSPLEHVVFTFLVHCPLFVRSQWHRNRTWSFNEVSRRYTEVDIEFYVPPQLRGQASNDRQASVATGELDQDGLREAIENHHRESLDLYQKLLNDGVCREQARGILPQNLFTTFWGTVDLGNLLHFLDLRDSAHAQWEIRAYAQAIKQLVAPYLPSIAKTFDWFESDGDALS